MKNNPYYEAALAYIKEHDLNSLSTGTHVIEEGRLWVNIVETSLRPTSEALLEVHDAFIDIQIPLSGPETFGVKPRSECTQPRGEMDSVKDILFFDDAIEETVTVEAGEMIVFKPDTAHAPLIGSGPIRKAIFKVSV